jgi:glycogen phosphorylase
MHILGRMTVTPRLPQRLSRLGELVANLFWTWDPDARHLFRMIDRDLWETVGHNPVVFLRDVAQERLEACASNEDFVRAYRAVMKRFDDDLGPDGWRDPELAESSSGRCYAYFCAEYGWSEAFALYSGGLGVLAGDHTKAASDLGVPLVGVGLWYPEGYFHQRVAADGRQEAVYERHTPLELPLHPVCDAAGKRVVVNVAVFGREVAVQAWRVDAGRVPVYLLDVDVAANHPDDRGLLRRLYGGDQRTRIAQELVLGVAGVRMLRALGYAPSAWHMNEGHSAFMALERCRELVAQGMPFAQARETVAASTVFTVHTPVAAGNDAFAFDLVGQAFGAYHAALGLRPHEFFDLGRADHGWGPVFSMPALALRFTSARNGVAALHGDTSRRIWSDLWPEVPIEEVPIGHVTNGVHVKSWQANELRPLLSTVLPSNWQERLTDVEMWRAIEDVDPASLWLVRKSVKAKSVRFLRRRVLRQLARHEASPTTMRDIGHLFDATALTIGFARRFATYKRATLIFRDLDRLAALLGNEERPVQLVFAGKAHPADEAGQALIATIQRLSQEPRFAGRIIFLEDYDMAVGRALTRGVDVWLNTPRRPLEASGTSGQKAAMNGILNLSVLDGWWPEGFDGRNGWAIGAPRQYDDEARADAADADALYALLESEVVPTYYDRDETGVPVAWMRRAAAAIATVTPRFNAHRMVRDYVERYYQPAAERGEAFEADPNRAADLAAWRERVHEHWPTVQLHAKPLPDAAHTMGEAVSLAATLHPHALGDLDLRVEVVYSLEGDALQHGLHRVPMRLEERLPDGGLRYVASFEPAISGRLAYGVRVLPIHRALASPFEAHAIRWA